MLETSNIDCWTRRRLESLSILPVMLLALSLSLLACGDKEEAAEPSHLTETSQAREAIKGERSQRQLAEARLRGVLRPAMLGACGALVLGLPIGFSRRKSEGD